MLTPAQIAERSTFIGASESASAIGLPGARHRPIQVYASKVGEAAPFEGNEATELGDELEEPVARIYARHTGATLVNPCVTFRHKLFSWMGCTPDRLIEGTRKGVEIKTVGLVSPISPEEREEWEEGYLPFEKLCQVHHTMAVMDAPEWDLACLIGGMGYRCYNVKRDPDIERNLVSRLAAFWFGHVVPRIPPPLDDSPACADWLRHKFQSSKAQMRRATTAEMLWAEELFDLRDEMAKLAKRDQALENKLMASIQDAGGIFWSTGKIHWRTNKRGARPFRPRRSKRR